jgi:hypothetical protein
MDPILRRTLIWYLLHLMTYSGLLGRFLLTDRWPAFEVLPLFVPVWLVSAVLFSEREESYAFLRMLPVTDRAIVRTKFGLILSTAAVFWLAIEGVALARGDDGMVGPETHVYITLVSVAALLFAACCQIGIWRFGAQTATPFVLAYMAATLVFAVAHTASLKYRANWPIFTQLAGVRWLADSMWLSHVVLIALALLAFHGLMRIGVRVKTSSEAHL